MPTVNNVASDIRPLEYQFDKVSPERTYFGRKGFLPWCYLFSVLRVFLMTKFREVIENSTLVLVPRAGKL